MVEERIKRVFIGIVVLIMGCVVIEEKDAPFLGTEWKLVSTHFSDGDIQPEEGVDGSFWTYTITYSTMVKKQYNGDGVFQGSVSYPVFEVRDDYFVVFDSWDANSDGVADYTGKAKVWYTVSGNEMKWTNAVSTLTNTLGVQIVKPWIGPGSGDPYVVSYNFVAKE